MGKVIALLTMAFLLMASGLVVAENNVTTNQTSEDPIEYVGNETEISEDEVRNVSVMETKEGALVRLMQLEGALEERVFQGEKIVAELLAKDPETDVERMEEILAELEDLLQRVQMQIGNISNQEQIDAREVAQEFVLLRREALSLTNEFRQLSHATMPTQDQEMIREKIREARNPDVEQKKSEIQERIREHNANQVKRFIERIGLENETLVDQVKSGELNVGQAISSVAREYRGLGHEKKQEALTKVREENARAQVHKDSIREPAADIAKEMQKRATERKEAAQERVSNIHQRITDDLKARGLERAALVRDINNAVKSIADRDLDKVADLTDDAKERIEQINQRARENLESRGLQNDSEIYQRLERVIQNALDNLNSTDSRDQVQKVLTDVMQIIDYELESFDDEPQDNLTSDDNLTRGEVQ